MYEVKEKQIKKYRVCCENCGGADVTIGCVNAAWDEDNQKWVVSGDPSDGDGEGWCNDCEDDVSLDWSIFFVDPPKWE